MTLTTERLDEIERGCECVTEGPWEYVGSTIHHGPYVTSCFGSTVCDLYVMSNPASLSVRNGGTSKPIHHLSEMADPNAAHIARCDPDTIRALVSSARANAKLVEALKEARSWITNHHMRKKIDAALEAAGVKP